MYENRSLPARRAQNFIGALLLSLAVGVLLAASAGAAPSDLDATFGSGGIATNALGYGGDNGNAVAVQADGKTVAVGRSQDPADSSDDQFVFSRYLDNGLLDPSFGIGGQAAVSFGGGEAAALDIAIQPDGKILAVGYAEDYPDYSMAVTRINSNGSLDTGFRGGGKFELDASDSGDDDGTGIALAPDGTFYVVGSGQVDTDLDFMVYKFKANGDDDTSFSGNGNTFTHFDVGDDGARAAAVQPDGKLVVAGFADTGAYNGMAVTRYQTNGNLDTSFSGTGKATFQVGALSDAANDVAIAPDGKIVLAGESDTAAGYAFAAVRLSATGILDSTFDGDGKASFKIGEDARASDMVLQRDGKLLIAGSIELASVSHAGLVQFNANGSVDLSYGLGGYVRTVIGTSSYFSGSAEAPNGKIVVTGASFGDTVVARYMGEYVAPPAPVPAVALKTKFSSKLKSKMKAKDLKSIAGTAVGTGLAKIQVSINLADKNLLKKKKQCLFVKNSKGSTKKYKAKKKKCAPAKWLTASGTTSWKYKLKGKLKPGKYTIYVRAVDSAGKTQTSFTKSRGNLKAVTVTK